MKNTFIYFDKKQEVLTFNIVFQHILYKSMQVEIKLCELRNFVKIKLNSTKVVYVDAFLNNDLYFPKIYNQNLPYQFNIN